MTDPTPAETLATPAAELVVRVTLRQRIEAALLTTPATGHTLTPGHERWEHHPAPGETGHNYTYTCALCCNDSDALTDALTAVVARYAEQLTAGRATWKRKAEEIEAARDRWQRHLRGRLVAERDKAARAAAARRPERADGPDLTAVHDGMAAGLDIALRLIDHHLAERP